MTAIATLIVSLLAEVANLLSAQGDPDKELQALLRQQRLISDELMRRGVDA